MIAQTPLPLSRIAAYALPAFPLAALGLPIGVFIPPLYAEHTTLALGLVGTLLFISRIGDVFTDPTFGLIADRMRPRLGRRRFWMLVSLPILMFSVWKLFHPPTDSGALYLVLWLSVVYVGYTMAFLSHLAWGAELSSLYDDRSRILGWREVVVTAGMLSVLILPALLVEGATDADVALPRAHIMSLFVIIFLPITIGLTCLLVPDPLPPIESMDSSRSIFDDLRAIAQNTRMPTLIIADLATTTAIGMTASLYVWVTVHVLQLADSTSVILIAYFAAAVISVPLWMRLSLRREKHTTYSAAMLYGALTLGTYALVPGHGLFWALLVSALYGCAYGAGFFLGRAIVADIADEDELETGQKRMAVFFSGLTLNHKIGFALGPLIAYNVLDLVGFDPNGVVTQAQADWLLGVFIGLPVAFLIFSGLMIRRHTLTRAEHDKIRKALNTPGAL